MLSEIHEHLGAVKYMYLLIVDATVLSKTLNCSSHTLRPVFCHFQRLSHTIISHYYALTQYIPKPLCNITNTYEQIMNSVQSRMSLYTFYTLLSFCLYSQPPMRHRKKCSDFGLYPDF